MVTRIFGIWGVDNLRFIFLCCSFDTTYRVFEQGAQRGKAVTIIWASLISLSSLLRESIGVKYVGKGSLSRWYG